MPLSQAVGQNAPNFPPDVLQVQQLLANNASLLVPAQIPQPTGLCDGQTLYLIGLFQQRALNLPQGTGRVEPDSPTWFALNGTSGGSSVNPVLDEALRLLRSEVDNFSIRFIQDADVRANYVAKAQEFSQDLVTRVQNGELTAEAAAHEAHTLRNGLLDASRLKSSDIGRAVAEAEKASGRTIEELMSYYSSKLFNREFNQLAAAEQDAVFMEIVRAAGRPNPRWNAIARGLGKAGRALIVVSLAVSAYSIATSDRPGRQAAKEATSLAAGFLGSVAVGAAAGAACGPGAPVCVTVGVLVGGIVFALGSDLTFDWLWN